MRSLWIALTTASLVAASFTTVPSSEPAAAAATTVTTASSATSAATIGVPTVIPRPDVLEPQAGQSLDLGPDTRVLVDGGEDVTGVGERLAEVLRPATGFKIAVTALADRGEAGPSDIVLDLSAAGDITSSEGYVIDVDSAGVAITASEAAGLFRGVQTLRQLLPPAIEADTVQDADWTLPGIHIEDDPRYAYRGAGLDPARHFLTVDEVKRFMDQMALYKLNTLHLHLTDDTGWRIQIDSWPNLTSVGARTDYSGGAGGFYTKADYAELIRYAQERFITVVPEINMPSHSNAALASYGELTCSGTANPLPWNKTHTPPTYLCPEKDVVYGYVDDVIGEIAAMTPGPYIHIGSDEPVGLSHDRYKAFLQRAIPIAASHGKTLIGWNEILDAEPPASTVVQVWRDTGRDPGAHPVILSPRLFTYLNFRYDDVTPTWAWPVEGDRKTTVEESYSLEPGTFLPATSTGTVLGVEAWLWGENIKNIAELDFLAFPRLPGLAERSWSEPDDLTWSEYRRRLGAHGDRWDTMGIGFYRSPEVDWRQPAALAAQTPASVMVGADAGGMLPVTLTNDSVVALDDVRVTVTSTGASASPTEIVVPRLEPGQSHEAAVKLSWPVGAPLTSATVTLDGSWTAAGEPQQARLAQTQVAGRCGPGLRSPAAIAHVSSEETAGTDRSAEYTIDGNPQTFWHTRWSDQLDRHPHTIDFDLGAAATVCGVEYLPLQVASVNGTVADYQVFVSTDGEEWGSPVASGRFAATKTAKYVPLPPTAARYIRFVALSEINGNPWASMAEFRVDHGEFAPPIQATASSRCIGGKVALTVVVKNTGQDPVDLQITTDFGRKTFAAVAPGRNAFHAFTTRQTGIPAGEATVEATATVDGATVSGVTTVGYDARSCG